MTDKADKDRPSTWRKYRNGMCNSCTASCCTMPVEVKIDDLIRLGLATEDGRTRSVKKLAKNLIKQGILKSYREATELFMLNSRPDGDCIYLDPYSRKCREYAKRPEVCRSFPEVGPRQNYCPYRSS